MIFFRSIFDYKKMLRFFSVLLLFYWLIDRANQCPTFPVNGILNQQMHHSIWILRKTKMPCVDRIVQCKMVVTKLTVL